MAFNERYLNNVVFTKDAVQDLLTNIKNYPIIDVNYVTKEEKESTNSENSATIWQIYGRNKPCLKITYGDKSNIEGKLRLASAPLRARYYAQKREFERLSNLMSDLKYSLLQLNKAWNENEELQSAKIQEIQSLLNDIEAKSGNKQDYLTSIVNIINVDNRINISGDIIDNNHELTTPNTIRYNDVNFEISMVTRVSDNTNQSMSATYSFLTESSQASIINRITQVIEKLKEVLGEETYNTTLKTIIEDNIVNFIRDYNNLVFLEKRIAVAGDSIDLTADITPEIAHYLNFNTIETSYNALMANHNPYVLHSNEIKTISNSILQVINNNLKTIKNRLLEINTAIEWLNTIHTTTSSKIINGKTETVTLAEAKKTFEDIKDEIASLGGSSAFGYKYIKTGDSLNFDENFENLYIKVTATDSYDPLKLYYVLSGGQFVPQNINNLTDFNNYRNNLYFKNQAIKLFSPATSYSSEQTYYLLEEEEYNQTIVTNQDFANYIENGIYTKNNIPIQAGNIRININGDFQDIPVCGFGNTSTTKLIISTDSSDVLTNDKGILISAKKSAEPDEIHPIVLDGDVKINYNVTPTGNLCDLGSQDMPWHGIYTDFIKIGNLSFGDTDINDTSKFLRSDGQWSNEITGPLTIGTTGGINITNTTEAERYTTSNYQYNAYKTISALYNEVNNSDVLAEISSTTSGPVMISFASKTCSCTDANSGQTVETTICYVNTEATEANSSNNIYIVGGGANHITTNNIYVSIIEPDAQYPLDTTFYFGEIQVYANKLNQQNLSETSGWNSLTGTQIQGKNDTNSIKRIATFANGPDQTIYQYQFKDSSLRNTYYISSSGAQYTVDNSYDADTQIYTKEEVRNDPAAGITFNNNGHLVGSITTLGGIAAAKDIKACHVHGAVFNDYAEFRHTEHIAPGYCVIETGKGDLILSTQRMQLGANIISDTYGFSIGETEYANTPIAVCGRVLAYTYEDRETYKPGEAVCSGPNGTISRMTREEIRNWPDAIVGYVSEIPQYKYWGSNNIAINDRIWIKIK